jgi:hypothetical protein
MALSINAIRNAKPTAKPYNLADEKKRRDIYIAKESTTNSFASVHIRSATRWCSLTS